MNPKNSLLFLLILMCAAQLVVPAAQIFQFERILSSGREYKFRTAPVDPTDPFRGKYISLAYKDNQVLLISSKNEYIYGQKVYTSVVNNEDGFARISSISKAPSLGDKDYFQSTIVEIDSHQITLAFPFDQYYMEETKAPQAEKIYNKNSTDTSQMSYALVRIKNGQALVQDVYIHHQRISDLIKKN